MSQRLNQLKDELSQIQAAKTAILTNGQSHNLTGSHSFTGVSYKELVKRESQLENQIIALSGGRSYTLPDFS